MVLVYMHPNKLYSRQSDVPKAESILVIRTIHKESNIDHLLDVSELVGAQKPVILKGKGKTSIKFAVLPNTSKHLTKPSWKLKTHS